MDLKQDKELPKFEGLAMKEESNSLNQDKEQKTESKKNISKNASKIKTGKGQKKQIKKEAETVTLEYLRGKFYVRSKEYWEDLKKLKILDPSPENENQISITPIE